MMRHPSGVRSVLCLVLARGGSKGLPGKNIRSFSNKPLIAWTILAARQSKYCSNCIISTDDEDIRQVALEYNGEVPFLRPSSLASDQSPSMDSVFHAMEWLDLHDYSYEYVALLQPTSPLRTSHDINCACELLFASQAQSCISVTECEHPPQWNYVMGEDGCLAPLFPDMLQRRRQDIPPSYRPNGAIYLARKAWLRENRSFIGSQTIPYVMPGERSIDIDSIFDFQLAEFLAKASL